MNEIGYESLNADDFLSKSNHKHPIAITNMSKQTQLWQPK